MSQRVIISMLTGDIVSGSVQKQVHACMHVYVQTCVCTWEYWYIPRGPLTS